MTSPVLQVVKVSKCYRINGKVVDALRSVSFDLSAGEIVSLLGVNGAGKSTLLSILVSLIPPTSGQVVWNGQPIGQNLFSYRKQIGYSPQRSNLDPVLTLEQNLFFAGRYFGLSKEQVRDRKELLIEQFQLTKVVDLPLDALSGGYRQRFLLARSLMHDPRILILDEPTVALDPASRNQMLDLIASLKKEGKTIILATHHLDEAETLSDRIVVIDQGRIIQIDTPDKLKEKWQKTSLNEVFLHLLKMNSALKSEMQNSIAAKKR